MKLISTAEVARRLGIHHYSVCRIIRDGRLPAQMIGKSWVVTSEDVEELEKTYEAETRTAQEAQDQDRGSKMTRAGL